MPGYLSLRISSAACLTLLLTTACGKKHTSASAPRTTPSAAAARGAPGTTQVGLASWYGVPYHGRRAANGEVYDMNKLTAAHRTLPFDTLVKVRNLDNDREVQVRINDRGPFVGDRIIDLSRAAAQQISMIGPGIVKVRLEVMGTQREVKLPTTPAPAPVLAPPPTPLPEPLRESAPASPAPPREAAPEPYPDLPLPAQAGVVSEPAAAARPAEVGSSSIGYAVQIGAFSELKAADKLQRQMASRYGSAYIENVRTDKGLLYRVRVGPAPTMAEAAQIAGSLQRENIETLVVQVAVPPAIRVQN
jgi:rare lipoprotein A